MTLLDPSSPAFDYAALDAETRIVVQQRTSEIKTLVRRSAQDIIDIGLKLTDVKTRLEHGVFTTWLQAEFAWSHRTADNMMRVADKFANFANLGAVAPSALYLLAAPSTPDDVVDQVIQRAQAGEPITYTAARQAVDDARPAPRPDVVAALQPRILNVLSGGPLTYPALRDALGIKPTDRDAYDLRTALDTLYGRQQLRKKNGQIHIVEATPPPPPAESGGEAPADTSAQGADGVFRILDQPMDHPGLVLHILRAGPQPFKLLLQHSGLSVGDLRAAMNTLLGTKRIVGKAGFYALADHADRLDDAARPAAGDPYTVLLDALRAHAAQYPRRDLLSRDWLAKHCPLKGDDLETALQQAKQDGCLRDWTDVPGNLFKRLAVPPDSAPASEVAPTGAPAGATAGGEPAALESPAAPPPVDPRTLPGASALFSTIGPKPSAAPTGLPTTPDTARELIVDALRKSQRPLGRGELQKYAGIEDKTVFETALDAMLAAGSLTERTTAHGTRAYHFAHFPAPAAPEPDDPDGDAAVTGADEPAAGEDHPLGVFASSKSPEWYTPPDLITLARRVLGAIDLDPASSMQANQTVQAARYFSEFTDGLAQSWANPDGSPARVWLNPPFGKGVIDPWIDKLRAEVAAGHVAEALVLVAARTETQWMAALAPYPRCFIRGRVDFVPGPANTAGDNGASFPSVVLYIGPRADRFAEVFSERGDVYRLWKACTGPGRAGG